MFLSLDEDHNGTLTINDIRKGMENIDNMVLSNSIVVVRKNPEEYK